MRDFFRLASVEVLQRIKLRRIFPGIRPARPFFLCSIGPESDRVLHDFRIRIDDLERRGLHKDIIDQDVLVDGFRDGQFLKKIVVVTFQIFIK